MTPPRVGNQPKTKKRKWTFLEREFGASNKSWLHSFLLLKTSRLVCGRLHLAAAVGSTRGGCHLQKFGIFVSRLVLISQRLRCGETLAYCARHSTTSLHVFFMQRNILCADSRANTFEYEQSAEIRIEFVIRCGATIYRLECQTLKYLKENCGVDEKINIRVCVGINDICRACSRAPS